MSESSSGCRHKLALTLACFFLLTASCAYLARAAGAGEPIFSIASGGYASSQSVSLTSATEGAAICYTTDGSTPSATTPGTCDAGSTAYAGAINVNATQTIKALSTMSGYDNSSVVSATYIIGDFVTFTTTGASFAPIITATGATVQWVFGDGQTSTSIAPSIAFADAASRVNYLQVSPWSAVTKINLGYNATHGGTTAGSGETTFASLATQNVSAVTGLSNVAPSLVRWSSLGGTMTSLDFSNFTSLAVVECYQCNALSSINLDGTSSLSRLNIETSAGTGLSGALDLSDSPNMTDLRLGATTPASIVWPTAGMTSLTTLSYHDNGCTGINLTGATGLANLELDDNQLSDLDLTGLSALKFIDLDDNVLTQSELDEILATLDGFGTSNGYLDIRVANGVIPSLTGQASMNNLIERGWAVEMNGTILTLSKAGNGGTGTITATIGAQSHTSDSSFYANRVAAAAGTSITLSATADAGSSFSGWTGGGCSGTGTCTLTLNSNITVAASFASSATGIRGPITYADGYNSSVGTTISAPARVHTAGNLIAVFVGAFQSTVDFGVSDTLGNTYAAVGTRYVADNSSITGQWFYAINAQTGENTVTATSSNSNRTIRVLEYAGIDASSPLDISTYNPGATTGNITTTAQNELLLSAWHIEGSYSCAVTSGGFGFVPDTNNFCGSGGVARPVTHKIVSAIQTNATTSLSSTRRESWGNPSRSWTVAFKGVKAAAPAFSVAGGTYASAQSVTLSSATSGTTICYTDDGTTPTTDGAGGCGGGTTQTYSSEISVSATRTIRAISTKSGINDSAVSIASYVIGTGIQGPISHAAVIGNSTAAATVAAAATLHTQGNFLAVFVAANNPGASISVSDTQGNHYEYADTLFAGSTGISGQWFYAFAGATGVNTVTATFANAGANYRTIRVLEYANIDRNDPVDVGGVHDSYATGTMTATSTAFDTNNPNELILAAWHLEGASSCTAGDGFTLLPNDYCGNGIGRPVEQKLVSSAQNATTAAFAMTVAPGAESYARVYRSWLITLNEAAPAAPEFSISSGTYISAQSVALSTATNGATICYTTDSTDPTATTPGTCDAGSSAYSTPISVGEGMTTLKALATKAGMNNGVVSSASYTVTNVMTFTTAGATFAPIITVTGAPTILWTFSDSTTSNSAAPSKDFGSATTRSHTLKVTPWSALTKINLGYDGVDGGTAPGTGDNTFASLAQQNVQSVTGLELIKDSLALWASSYNPITSLDFSDFTALTKVECYDCGALASIDIDNVSTIKRLGLEKDNLVSLDLTDAVNLEDLRGSDQDNGSFSITWGAESYPALWHVCAWGNPNTGAIPFNKFPILRDFYIGGDNQTGIFNPISTNLRSVLANDNGYTSADFSGNYPAGGNGIIDMDNNDLTSIDISDSPGLVRIDLHGNPLNQAQIDAILHNLDSFGVVGDGTGTNSYDDPYYVNLTDTSAPSVEGQAHADSLIARGWTILTDTVTLTVSPAGTGGTGTITGGSIDCGSTCSASLPPGSSVTLTAAPAEGSTFSGWSGGGCSGTGTCTVAVNADMTVAAIFGTTATGIQGPITNVVTRGNSTLGTTVNAPSAFHTAGNMLAVFAAARNPGAAISITDTNGNEYTAIGSLLPGATNISGQWFYTFNAATATNTVTAVMANASADYRTIRVLEYAGIDTSDPVDVSNIMDTYPAATIFAESSTFSTTSNSELILAAWHLEGASSCTAGDGFTLLPNDYCGDGIGRPVEQKIVSAIQDDATAGFNMTIAAGAESYARVYRSWMVSFKAAKPAAPTFSVPAGTYSDAQSVALSSTTSNATICYTTDGSDPATSAPGACGAGSTAYVSGSPISVGEGTTTIKTLATQNGMNDSPITSAAYIVMSDVALPSFSPTSGTYTGAQSITLSTGTADATLCYTLDGTDPATDGAGACVGSLTYTSPLSVSSSKTIKAIATRSGYDDSAVASASYVINPSSSGGGITTLTAAAPIFSPLSGTYTAAQTVTIRTATSGADIHYTLDGSTPTTSSAVYEAPLTVAATTTIKAIAVKTRYKNSAITSAAYVINAEAPTAPATPTDPTAPAPPIVSTDLPDGTLLKAPDSKKVYVLIEGKKKWIPTPEVFEQLGYQWTSITVLPQAQLEAIQDYEDNLIRQQGDYKVYLVVSGARRHIPNPAIFLDYGFRWEEVRDVPAETMNKYQPAFLLKQSGVDGIWYIAGGVRKLIPTLEIFTSYGNKLEDVQIVSQAELESYPITNLIRLTGSSDVYLVKNNFKYHIPSPEIFAKYRFDWNRVINVNRAELDYYQSGGALR